MNELLVSTQIKNCGLYQFDLFSPDDLPRFENKAFEYRSNVDGSSHQNAIPELSAPEETNESRAWRDSCPIGDNGEVKKIDLKVIEPYKKVLSHGGYYHHYNTTQINRNNTNQGRLSKFYPHHWNIFLFIPTF